MRGPAAACPGRSACLKELAHNATLDPVLLFSPHPATIAAHSSSPRAPKRAGAATSAADAPAAKRHNMEGLTLDGFSSACIGGDLFDGFDSLENQTLSELLGIGPLTSTPSFDTRCGGATCHQTNGTSMTAATQHNRASAHHRGSPGAISEADFSADIAVLPPWQAKINPTVAPFAPFCAFGPAACLPMDPHGACDAFGGLDQDPLLSVAVEGQAPAPLQVVDTSTNPQQTRTHQPPCFTHHASTVTTAGPAATLAAARGSPAIVRNGMARKGSPVAVAGVARGGAARSNIYAGVAAADVRSSMSAMRVPTVPATGMPVAVPVVVITGDADVGCCDSPSSNNRTDGVAVRVTAVRFGVEDANDHACDDIMPVLPPDKPEAEVVTASFLGSAPAIPSTGNTAATPPLGSPTAIPPVGCIPLAALATTGSSTERKPGQEQEQEREKMQVHQTQTGLNLLPPRPPLQLAGGKVSLLPTTGPAGVSVPGSSHGNSHLSAGDDSHTIGNDAAALFDTDVIGCAALTTIGNDNALAVADGTCVVCWGEPAVMGAVHGSTVS